MKPCLTSDQMRESDRLTMKKLGISSFELMDRVSDCMVEEIFRRVRDRPMSDQSIQVLCGPGNNGGDGYRVAEKLRRLGLETSVLQVLEPQSEDCRKAARLCRAQRITEVTSSSVIIDAIFGNGARSQLSRPVVSALKSVNRARGYRIALDSPTGLDSSREDSSGRSPHAHTFRADLTLCVGFYKDFLVETDAAHFLGEIICIADFFAVPRLFENASAKKFGIGPEDFHFQSRMRNSFKSQGGHCGVVGGSSQTPGAAFLAGEAAYRVGAGYVSVFFADHKKLPIHVRDSSFLLNQRWKMEDLQKVTALVVGCGGFSKRIRDIQIPHIIDAEAMLPLFRTRSRAIRLFTPHPGEAAKLLKTTTAMIESDRWGSLHRLVKIAKSAVYLKGAPGILQFYNPEESDEKVTYISMSVNPVFSKAGSGDILAGILGGFLVQGIKRGISFENSILSGLSFQREIGEILRSQRAAWPFDQLLVFSEAFRRLGSER